MSTAPSGEPTPRKPLRLWPGVVIAILLVLARFVLPLVAPDAMLFAIVGGLFGGVAVVVWWLFFSRAPWPERVGAILIMIVAIVAIRPLTHESIQNGMMGGMFFVYAIPTTLSLAFVAWAAASRRLSGAARWAAMVAAIALGCGFWTLIRTNGILGGGSDLAWRWTPTAEDRLLAQARDEPKALPEIPAPAATATSTLQSPALQSPAWGPPSGGPGPATGPRADSPVHSKEPIAAEAIENTAARPPAAVAATIAWPGFRGPERNGVVRGVRIDTNWSSSPPTELWRRPIGPGWSSFAVRGDLLYTQEQRGDDEVVSAYSVSTGEPVWRHRDTVRFWESNGGAGPRGTPTISHDHVYSFGATGILNALDASTGAVVWSRNVASDTGRRVPDWGFTSSPLVIDDVVIVAAAGTLAGYDVVTGDSRWRGPSYGGSYSSPHRATIDGAVQIVLLGGPGALGVAPADGAVLWKHEWAPGAIVQPAVMANGDIVINAIASTGGTGTRRLAIARGTSGWSVEERWTSNGLKPYFNDFVVHEGHAYGFDGSILACIDLEDGTRKWKGGRYGSGQLVLLPDQDVLLVLSEEGELALVSATPDKFTEVARFPALEGKTWNHPVVVGDVLLVRNGEEMAAFRLPLANR